jgi:hypothetical protein
LLLDPVFCVHSARISREFELYYEYEPEGQIRLRRSEKIGSKFNTSTCRLGRRQIDKITLRRSGVTLKIEIRSETKGLQHGKQYNNHCDRSGMSCEAISIPFKINIQQLNPFRIEE